MRADDVHGARSTVTLVQPDFRSSLHRAARGWASFENRAVGCYKPTVNESETITEAQPFCRPRNQSAVNEPPGFGFRYPLGHHIGRS